MLRVINYFALRKLFNEGMTCLMFRKIITRGRFDSFYALFVLMVAGSLLPNSAKAKLDERVISEFCTDWVGECEHLAETVLTISREEADRLSPENLPSWTLRARNSERSAALIMEPSDAFEVTEIDNVTYEVKLVAPQELFKLGVGNNFYRVPVRALYVVSTQIEIAGSSESQCYSVATFRTNSGDVVDVEGLDYELKFSPSDAVDKYFMRNREFLIKPAPGYAGQTITATLAFDGSKQLQLRPLHLILCNTKALPAPEKKLPADAPVVNPEVSQASSEKWRFIPRVGMGGTVNPTVSYSEGTTLPGLILAVELENAPRFYVRAETEMTIQNSGSVGLSYLDMRFTPYFFTPRKSKETQGLVTLLSGNVSRNIHTGRNYQVRVSAVAFEGRAYSPAENMIQAYVDAAARLIALNLENLRQNTSGVAAGFGVGDVEMKAGLVTSAHAPVVYRIYLGASMQGNIGAQTTAIDLRAQAGMSLEILKYLEIFVRAQMENLISSNQLTLGPNIRLVSGVGLIF